jgi:hypothetical protein
VAPSLFPRIHAALGNKKRALEGLEKCFEQRDKWLFNPDLLSQPTFDSLRSEPRFMELKRKMGLKE